ncbi:MAG: hypothetical protein JWM76_411 [Pseudonocardiales bacterium]|nr:hypothetical protein [Pseudonocardiales bacterium]
MSNPQVVVVIGASSGIGQSTARALATRGDHLVLAARSESRLKSVAAQCEAQGAGRVLVQVTDINEPAQVQALIDRTTEEFGRIDVVVHTATVMAYGTIENLDAEVFTTVVDTAINGTFIIARAVLRVFRKQDGGTLVIVNSLLGSIVAPELGAYATAKWGQAGMIRALQIETRNQRSIKICSVSPGSVNTPIYSQAANYTGKSPRPPIPVDPPEKVARAIVGCIDKPKPRVSVGLANPVAILGFRLFPAVFDLLVTPLLHVGSLINPPTKSSPGNVLTPTSEGEAEHGPWNRRWQPRGASPRPDDEHS